MDGVDGLGDEIRLGPTQQVCSGRRRSLLLPQPYLPLLFGKRWGPDPVFLGFLQEHFHPLEEKNPTWEKGWKVSPYLQRPSWPS